MHDRAISAFASRQHGLITRQQARAIGSSDRMISCRVASGAWIRLHAGVFAIAGAPRTWEQGALAAVLAAGAGAAASHRTAARLWAVVDRAGRLEVTVPEPRHPSIQGVTVHRSAHLPAPDLTRLRAIPVTSLARTIIDASAHQRVSVVGQWIDEAVRHKGLELEDLRRCVARLSGPGRRHTAPVREALGERLPGYDPGDSELEVRAMRALARAGLPPPVQQHPVTRPDGRQALIDLAYPEDLVAIELDGWSAHGHRSAFHADRIRRNELTLLGWRVFQFTATTDGDALAATVSRALQVPTPRPPSFPTDDGR